MTRTSYINFILIIVLIQTVTACNNYHSDFINGDYEVILEKRFPISPGNDLKIKVNGGDVIVTMWDKPEVYFKISGNENAKEKLDFKFSGNNSYVELIADSKGSFFNWLNSVSLKVEVKVPRQFNTNLRTSGGDIKLGGVEGNHELKTSGGDIICEKFAGTLDASTSGGDVTLTGSNSPIIAHTSGGDIKLDYSGENMGIDLSTSGGDIFVKLPADFNAAMELSTSGGDVSCNLTLNNATKLSENKLVADLNNGGNDFIAHTSGGDIDVRKK
jgi:DUF4097 and DUF4098 domain-containing protein YvlB